jgi:hypothetical protein
VTDAEDLLEPPLLDAILIEVKTVRRSIAVLEPMI